MAMGAADFQFALVDIAGYLLLQVQQDGRVLGTIAEEGGSYIATGLSDGEVLTRQFASRDAAAQWLATLK
jgi:hypothetical protein